MPHYNGLVAQQLRIRSTRLPTDQFKTHDLDAPWPR